jgi:transketolase
MTTEAGSGHPTSGSSMAEVTSVLFFDPSGMHYNPKNPSAFTNDRFVLSKGHCAPILYAAWAEAGFLDKKECLRLRKFDCELEGHPMPRLPFVDVGTGSLG